MAMTWKTPEVLRLNKIHLMNGTLRRYGFAQRAPGVAPSYASVAKRGVGIALMSRQEFQTRNLVLWAKSGHFGRMFWFILKMLVGSYFRFTTWSL